MARISYAEAKAVGWPGETTACTWLYRLFNAGGDLLYVGITKNPPYRRFNAHARLHPWWPQVTQVELEIHQPYVTALARERAAIKAEAPRFNSRSAVTCGR